MAEVKDSPFPLCGIGGGRGCSEAGPDLLDGGVELGLGLGGHLDLRSLEPLPLQPERPLLLPKSILLPGRKIIGNISVD